LSSKFDELIRKTIWRIKRKLIKITIKWLITITIITCIIVSVVALGESLTINKFEEQKLVSEPTKAIFSETDKGELVIESAPSKESCEEQIIQEIDTNSCASIQNVKFNKLIITKPTLKKSVI